MVVTNALVIIKRMSEKEIDALDQDVKSLLKKNEDGSSIFHVQPAGSVGEGLLHKCGLWKESSGRIMGGIHTLLVKGVKTDMAIIAAAVKTEQVLLPVLLPS